MRTLSVFVFVAALLLLNLAALICSAQVQLPDTPAARQCAAWLESFNRGTPDAYRDFLQKNFPSRAAHADQEVGFREMVGGFELRKVEESTPVKLVALVQERISDQFARLTLEVEAAEPHRIKDMSIWAIPRPAEFPFPI